MAWAHQPCRHFSASNCKAREGSHLAAALSLAVVLPLASVLVRLAATLSLAVVLALAIVLGTAGG